VITVCDQAAGETCPLWPGRPVTAHWGYADPSAVQGGIQAQRAAFAQTLGLMRQRVQAWVALPPTQLQADVLSQTLRELAHQP
jgi:protein-tyrosine-phosphatase